MTGVAIIGLLAWSGGAHIDTPLAPPVGITHCSANRRFCAVADPQRDAVAIYRVEGGDDRRTELWAITPWQRVFDLANDGDHLVVCYSGQNLLPLHYKQDWPMLEFYERHKVVRRWSLGELVPDLRKLRRTVSHYEWGNCLGFDSAGRYQVRTVDRGLLRFDASTGKLTE